MRDLLPREKRAREKLQQRHWRLLDSCNEKGMTAALPEIKRFIEKCQSLRQKAASANLGFFVIYCDDRIWHWSIMESYVTGNVLHRIPVAVRMQSSGRASTIEIRVALPLGNYETQWFARTTANVFAFPLHFQIAKQTAETQAVQLLRYLDFGPERHFSLDELLSHTTRQMGFLENLGRKLEEAIWASDTLEYGDVFDEQLRVPSQGRLAAKRPNMLMMTHGPERILGSVYAEDIDYRNIELQGVYVLWKTRSPESLSLAAEVSIYV